MKPGPKKVYDKHIIIPVTSYMRIRLQKVVGKIGMSEVIRRLIENYLAENREDAKDGE